MVYLCHGLWVRMRWWKSQDFGVEACGFNLEVSGFCGRLGVNRHARDSPIRKQAMRHIHARHFHRQQSDMASVELRLKLVRERCKPDGYNPCLQL